MPTIVHFEIAADDLQRAKKFYSDLLGWKIEKVPGPMDYWMIATTDENGQPGLGGGMMPRQNPQHMVINYFDVPSVDQYTAKVEQAGGKIVMGKTTVPGMGYFAVCLDTENNPLGIWETDSNAA
jgi:predicted enzyme related to lactoylglutathione lyase